LQSTIENYETDPPDAQEHARRVEEVIRLRCGGELVDGRPLKNGFNNL
jgi:hypothetical protein